MTDKQDAIAAFIDGEAVDPLALIEALSEAAGREYLVDLLALRGLVASEHDGRSAGPTRPAQVVRHVRQIAVAASLAAVSLLGGYVWGQRDRSLPAPLPGPATVSAPRSSPAPAPTRIIRLESGVDWNERIGG